MDAESLNSLELITKFLVEFTDDLAVDQAIDMIEQTDYRILQLFKTLIESYSTLKISAQNYTDQIEMNRHQFSAQPSIDLKDPDEAFLEKSQSVLLNISEDSSSDLVHDAQMTESRLQQLLTSTHNPRFAELFLAVVEHWLRTGQPISRSQAQLLVNQPRTIRAYREAVDPTIYSSKSAILISELLIQEKLNGKIFMEPTELGLDVYKYSKYYLDKQQVRKRLHKLLSLELLNDTKKSILLYLAISEFPISNSSSDRKKVSLVLEKKGLQLDPDNVRRILQYFTKLGILRRIPDPRQNNIHYYHLYDFKDFATHFRDFITNSF
ncbi:MAG: hypothetical protein IH840_11300 [Candidatus Heimdallarchaeota archaeon]|nr:hypothetical protein [Candidatus Heimdallarchaeota archaeon]